MDLSTYVAFGLPTAVLGIGAVMLGIGWLARRAARRSRENRALVLEAVRRQQPDGTGYTLSLDLEARSGRRWFIASLYSYLHDLEREGTIASRWGEATAARGWRRPRHYWIVADMPHLVPGED